MASIREIAKRANVAPGTVSRTLNNKGYISKETREKVEQALKELDYSPNELARNLFRKRSNTIGIILPDIEHPFIMSIIKYLVKTLSKCDYHVTLWTTEYNADTELHFLDMLKRNIVDGVIIAIPLLPNEVYQSIARPIVMLDKIIEGIPLVAVDHEKAGRMAAEKFHECECRKVIVTTGNQSPDIPSSRRADAFLDSCRNLNIEAIQYEFPWTQFDVQYASKIASDIFSDYPDATGIFTSDLFAAACYREAVRRDIKIPDHFSIISTDGIYIADYGTITFSSVVQPTDEIARYAGEILLSLINEEENAPDRKLIDTYFQKGDTTAL